MRFVLVCGLLLFSGVVRAQNYCATKGGVKLRKGPQASAALSWEVPKYMPLAATGKKQGAWVEVKDVDGQSHWGLAKDLTTSWNCLVVQVKGTRLRRGPGSDFQVSPLGLADRYMAFMDLGGEDGWTQVQDEDGEKAWINLDHTWKAARRSRLSFDNE